MDRGAWWATVHGVAELDTIEATLRTKFIRVGSLARFLASSHCPEYSVGCIFIITGREERGRRSSLSFLSRRHVSLISSSPS